MCSTRIDEIVAPGVNLNPADVQWTPPGLASSERRRDTGMKAMLYHEPGGPEVLQYVDVPDPEPGPGDVVVKVGACALNRLDVVQRSGWFQMPGFTYPHIAGMDLAGEVIEVGDAVTEVSIGDRVVVDPSMAGVAENSKLSGMGDLFGDLGIIGRHGRGWLRRAVSRARVAHPCRAERHEHRRGFDVSHGVSDGCAWAVRSRGSCRPASRC